MQRMFKDRLQAQDIGKFMTFPQEEFIFATREHYVPLIFRMMQQISATLVVCTLMAALSFYFFRGVKIPSAVFLLSLLAGTGFSIKEIVHWYFHLYIITTKKLLEVRYSPLLSEAINSVLLDQVRCTEIDADLTGIISESLNLGNVTITFDRPTHQDYFVLNNVRAPRMIANLLSTQLHKSSPPEMQSLWTKRNQYDQFSYVGRVPYGTVSN